MTLPYQKGVNDIGVNAGRQFVLWLKLDLEFCTCKAVVAWVVAESIEIAAEPYTSEAVIAGLVAETVEIAAATTVSTLEATAAPPIVTVGNGWAVAGRPLIRIGTVCGCCAPGHLDELFAQEPS